VRRKETSVIKSESKPAAKPRRWPRSPKKWCTYLWPQWQNKGDIQRLSWNCHHDFSRWRWEHQLSTKNQVRSNFQNQQWISEPTWKGNGWQCSFWNYTCT
jgi:hypothetical protein